MKYLVISLLFLSGCTKDAITVSQTNNNEFNVGLLFEYDSCKVYRFEDGGRNRYFTNCKGTTEWQESCGKNCSRPNGVSGGK